MNIVVTVIAVVVGAFGGICAGRMAAEGVSLVSAVLGIAGAAAMIAGAVMARKNHAQAVKVLLASVAVFVAAVVLDTSGSAVEMFDEVIKGEEIFGGLAMWAAISAGAAMYSRKKAAKVKEG